MAPQPPTPLYPTVGTPKSLVREPTSPRGQGVWKVLLKCDTAGKRHPEGKGRQEEEQEEGQQEKQDKRSSSRHTSSISSSSSSSSSLSSSSLPSLSSTRRQGSPRPSRGWGFRPGPPPTAPTSRPSTESATSKPKRGAGWTASAFLVVANFSVPIARLRGKL